MEQITIVRIKTIGQKSGGSSLSTQLGETTDIQSKPRYLHKCGSLQGCDPQLIPLGNCAIGGKSQIQENENNPSHPEFQPSAQNHGLPLQGLLCPIEGNTYNTDFYKDKIRIKIEIKNKTITYNNSVGHLQILILINSHSNAYKKLYYHSNDVDSAKLCLSQRNNNKKSALQSIRLVVISHG